MNLAILAAILAQVPLPVPYPGGAQDDYQSPIVSLVAWDKGGSDSWGAGIPTPTIDCAAVGTSASASLQCSGASPSFAGPGQTAAGSPWWYRNDTAVRPSIVLNGSTDWWGLGDVASATNQIVVCSDVVPASVTGAGMIAARDNLSAGSWALYRNGSTYTFRAAKSGYSYSELSSGTASVGVADVLCFAYTYMTDGTSVIKGNVNGVVGAQLNVAKGPIQGSAVEASIGATSAAGFKFAGAIRRVTIWTGADAPTSAAQLAQLVATQWGLAADRPAGTVATHARTDSTLCCPFSDAECFWVGPGAPCIHAPTYSGWASGGAVAGGIEVFGIGQNKAVYSADLSQTATWVPTSSVGNTISAAKNAVGPDGVANSASTVTLTGSVTDPSAAYNALRQTVTVANATPHTFSAWFKAGTYTDATFPLDMVTGGTYIAGTNCPVSSTAWTRCSVTGTTTFTTALIDIGGVGFTLSGLHLTVGSGTILVYEPQLTPTAYPVPPRSTPGASSYTGTASTATTLTVPVALTDPSRWAIGLAYTGSGAWGVADRFWSLGTAANSAYLAAAYLGIFDAANAQRYSFVSPVLASGTHSTLVDYRSPTAALRIDGADRALSFTGAGSGVLDALSPTITIGNGPSPGLVSRVVQCRRAGGCR